VDERDQAAEGKKGDIGDKILDNREGISDTGELAGKATSRFLTQI